MKTRKRNAAIYARVKKTDGVGESDMKDDREEQTEAAAGEVMREGRRNDQRRREDHKEKPSFLLPSPSTGLPLSSTISSAGYHSPSHIACSPFLGPWHGHAYALTSICDSRFGLGRMIKGQRMNALLERRSLRFSRKRYITPAGWVGGTWTVVYQN